MDNALTTRLVSRNTQRMASRLPSKPIKTVPKFEMHHSSKIIISSPRSINSLNNHSTSNSKENNYSSASVIVRKSNVDQHFPPIPKISISSQKQNLLLIKPIQPMNQILQNLFLGNINAARSIEYLKKYNITHVLSVVDFAFVNKQYDLCKPPISHMVIKAPDQESFNLLASFDKAIEFIRKAIHNENGIVLVH